MFTWFPSAANKSKTNFLQTHSTLATHVTSILRLQERITPHCLDYLNNCSSIFTSTSTSVTGWPPEELSKLLPFLFLFWSCLIITSNKSPSLLQLLPLPLHRHHSHHHLTISSLGIVKLLVHLNLCHYKGYTFQWHLCPILSQQNHLGHCKGYRYRGFDNVYRVSINIP